MEKEIWKDITNYEGLYQISNFGRIKSLRADKLLKPEVLKNGYLRIQLFKNPKRERFMVHRLVLCEFIEHRTYPEYEANHKDFNVQNNRLDNLEWVTNQENADHKYQNKPELVNKLKESMSHIGKKYHLLGVEASKKPVARYGLNGDMIDFKMSAREYVPLGFNYKGISACCTGYRKTYKGYIFKFYTINA